MQCDVRDDGYITDPEEVLALKKLMHFAPISTDDSGEIFMCYRREGDNDWKQNIYVLSGTTLSPVVGIASTYWDTDPAISSDGTVLYFASDRAQESQCLQNIYVTRRKDLHSPWSAPI